MNITEQLQGFQLSSLSSSKMTNQTSITVTCQVMENALVTAVFLIIFALPVHLLMIKILYKDCQLVLPRHKIMMSLTISDALQISTLSLTTVTRKIVIESSQNEVACKYILIIATFIGTVTLVASSLNIVSLSIERYISCIHSLHVYNILTTRRVVSALSSQWAIGIIIATAISYLREANQTEAGDMLFQRATILTVFPSAAIILVVQLRLLHLSRSKLATVKPVYSFGNQAEVADFRRKQVKVTFVASIVAIAYMACMIPLATLFAWEWHHGLSNTTRWRSFLFPLAMLNSLIDPLIYGVGIGETRKMIWKNIKQAKEFLLWRVCYVPSSNPFECESSG